MSSFDLNKSLGNILIVIGSFSVLIHLIISNYDLAIFGLILAVWGLGLNMSNFGYSKKVLK